MFRTPLALGAALAALALPAAALASGQTVNNGSQFVTTTGGQIDAHGGGVIKVGGYYYFLGENRNPDYSFRAVSMYRSTDLKTWEFRNDVLKSSSATELNGANIERPKIIYNATTGKYVLWAHWENGKDYGEARVAVATADTVDGNYTYLGSFRPLGYDSRDMTVYQDSDGTGYLISSSNVNYDLNIYKLSADYTKVDSLLTVIKGYHREAPALVKRNNVYFMITSGATGWNPNRAAYFTATNLAGPWTGPTYFGHDTTYNSQSTFILPVQGSSGTSYLYMGDRWGPAIGQIVNDSTYVWLPLTFRPTLRSISPAPRRRSPWMRRRARSRSARPIRNWSRCRSRTAACAPTSATIRLTITARRSSGPAPTPATNWSSAGRSARTRNMSCSAAACASPRRTTTPAAAASCRPPARSAPSRNGPITAPRSSIGPRAPASTSTRPRPRPERS